MHAYLWKENTTESVWKFFKDKKQHQKKRNKSRSKKNRLDKKIFALSKFASTADWLIADDDEGRCFILAF